MDVRETTIEDLNAIRMTAMRSRSRIMYGLAIGAGVLASAGLLGPAFVAGGALLLSEW